MSRWGLWWTVPLLTAGCVSTTLQSPLESGQVREDGFVPQVMAAVEEAPPSVLDTLGNSLAVHYGVEMVARWPMRSLDAQCLVFAVPRNRSTADVAARLAADHRVLLASAVGLYRTLEAEEDPYLQLQHNALALRLPDAHQLATGKGVRVALVDTGIDVTHPDLSRTVSAAHSFVRWDGYTGDLHGTAVAGVIAAEADNSIGIMGVAPDARLIGLKACWHEDPGTIEAHCTSYSLAQAIDTAIQARVHILNLSLTGPRDSILERLVQRAVERGITVIAAASDASEPEFPTVVPEVISVRAVDREGNLGSAEEPMRSGEVAAPGIEVLTTVPDGRYDFLSGSSLAAAHVSGVAALVLELDPRLSPAGVRTLLESGGDLPGAAALAATVGSIDACKVLSAMPGGRACGERAASR